MSADETIRIKDIGLRIQTRPPLDSGLLAHYTVGLIGRPELFSQNDREARSFGSEETASASVGTVGIRAMPLWLDLVSSKGGRSAL